MTKICCWCKKPIPPGEAMQSPSGRPIHDECFGELEQALAEDAKDYPEDQE